MSMLFDVHPGFRFVVAINGIPAAVFTECSLPNIEWDILEVKEGGLNSYVHQLPGLRKSSKITLKRGLVSDILTRVVYDHDDGVFCDCQAGYYYHLT